MNKNEGFAVVGGWADNINEKGEVFNKSELKSPQSYQQGEVLEFVENHGLYGGKN